MKTLSVEVLGEDSNAAVLRHPGREFPGVLIQGDSLHVLFSAARSALDAAERNDLQAVCEQLNELSEKLGAYQRAYESALDSAGVPLPYSKLSL